MIDNATDRLWEQLGRDDPYYGVLTADQFRSDRLTAADKEEFFRSGVEYVDAVLATVRRHIDPAFQVGRALDFGCGVARIVVPLAAIASEVTGVDISESMLAEARRNCEARGLRNVRLVKSDDALSALTGAYRFIHSFIVFQHIPVARGEKIFARLVDLLEDGGVGVLHVTYAKRDTVAWKALLRKHLPGLQTFANAARGRMQMNPYRLNRLFSILQAAGVAESHVQLTDHGGEHGVVLYFRKGRAAPGAA